MVWHTENGTVVRHCMVNDIPGIVQYYVVSWYDILNVVEHHGTFFFLFLIPSIIFALLLQLPPFRNSDQQLGHIA